MASFPELSVSLEICQYFFLWMPQGSQLKFLPKTLNIVFIVLSAVESRLYPSAREGRVHVSRSLPWPPGVSSEWCARASFVVTSRVWCSGAQQLHCGCHRGGVLFLWILLTKRTKWTPISWRQFQMHFLEWKYINFNQHFTEVCPQGSN